MYVLLMIRNNLFTTTLNKQLTYAQSLYIYIYTRTTLAAQCSAHEKQEINKNRNWST